MDAMLGPSAMNKLLVLLSASALTFLLAGCGGADVAVDEGASPSAEDEVRSTDLAGEYAPVTEDDDGYFESISVKRSGTKLSITIDGDVYDLQRTRSGAYVFTSGDLDGECDDPGCSYLTKVHGVVYLKKVGTRKVPHAKITMRRTYPYPEYEGDLDGDITETIRWKKRR